MRHDWKCAALAVCWLFASIVSTQAQNTLIRRWSEGPLPVLQGRFPSGVQFCAISIKNNDAKFMLARRDTGETWVQFGYDGIWTSGGSVSLTIDGTAFAHNFNVSPDEKWLLTPVDPTGGRDFLHALFNGYLLTVTAANVTRSFSLSGSATAIAVLLRCSEQIIAERGSPGVPFTSPPVQSAPTMLPTMPAPPGQVMAHLDRSHGAYFTSVILNGNTSAIMQVDSGASTVVIPEGIVVDMVGKGTVTEDDYLGDEDVVLADGSKVRLNIIMLRSVTIGGYMVNNVVCAVGNDNMALLLGRSLLAKFSSWSIDNDRSVLLLNPKLPQS
jgi:predicted aspartyl protease